MTQYKLVIPQGMMSQLKERGIDVSKAKPSPDVEGVWHMYIDELEKITILHALADLGVANVHVQL